VLLLLPFELCVAAVAAIMLANTIHTNKHMHMKGVVGGGVLAVQRRLGKGGCWGGGVLSERPSQEHSFAMWSLVIHTQNTIAYNQRGETARQNVDP